MIFGKTSLPRKVLSTITSDAPLLSKQKTGQFLVLAQAVFGLLWLEGASWKVLVDGKFALNYDGLTYWASRGSEFPVFEPYKQLLDKVILPNIELFLPLVFITELTIGVLFISGKYVRVAALAALIQTGAIALSVLNTPHEWKWSYILMALVSIVFFVMPTTSNWPNKLLRRK